MMQDAIYTITENSQKRNYLIENGGSLLNAAKLLYRMETIRGRLPKGSRLSVLEALNMNYDFFPCGITNRLLQPLQDQECSEAIKRIQSGESQAAYIKIDFDSDSFTHLCSMKDEVHQVTAPAMALAEVYGGSIRKKNDYQLYVNTRHFTAQLAAISEVKILNRQSEQTESGPKMDM